MNKICFDLKGEILYIISGTKKSLYNYIFDDPNISTIKGNYDTLEWWIDRKNYNWPTKRKNNTSIINKNTINANFIDSIVISNIPIPSNVTIGEELFEVLDGELVFTIGLPGVYQIQIDSFPYKDIAFEVIAT